MLAVLLVAVVQGLGCASWPGREPPAPRPRCRRATCPPSARGARSRCCPSRTRRGESLRIPESNVLKEIPNAIGGPADGQTALDVLQLRAGAELERRGFSVVPVEEVRSAVQEPPRDTLSAARVAREAGFATPVLIGTLRRFTLTQTGLLLIRLDLTLLDPTSGEVLWRGQARKPVPVRAALTWQEILLDAGGPIFADAFGTPP